MNLTESGRETILAFAANDMNATATARNMHLNRNTVVYRLDRITQKTGLSPWRFYDLVKLVEMASANMKGGAEKV